ncbi:phage protein NinX family protein [Thalassospira sp.]|uniref:phage protein NinX family protein n=1 Tax=Thalassospira sp. TaxID=1912094 RepID=UPI000C674B04|nr:phage protein NinX family protein [Thalassospira sp.]MAL41431.1 hypothetical protein [Thalassospira sp.]
MKVKVSELEGRALNYALAIGIDEVETEFDTMWCFKNIGFVCRADDKLIQIRGNEFDPSGNWAHGGPEIEKNSLQLNVGPYGCSAAYYNPDLDQFEGPDFEHVKPLVAAMRCIVFAIHEKDEIEIPDELMEASHA